MMIDKTLATLVRVKKYDLDELRQQLIEAERRRESLEEALATLTEEMEKEYAFSRENPLYFFDSEEYFNEVRKRQQQLAENMIAVSENVNILQKQLHEVFCETKQFELLKEGREQKQRKMLQRKEEQNFSEIALSRWQRRQCSAKKETISPQRGVYP